MLGYADVDFLHVMHVPVFALVGEPAPLVWVPPNHLYAGFLRSDLALLI